MKKALFTSLTAILVVCFLAFKTRLIQEPAIFQDNVEALTDDEGGGFASCYSEYKFHLTKRCLRCGTCDWVWGDGLELGGFCL